MEQLELDIQRPSLKQSLVKMVAIAKSEARALILSALANGGFKGYRQKGGLKK